MVAGTTLVEEDCCEGAGDGGVRGEVRWSVVEKGEVDQEAVDDAEEDDEEDDEEEDDEEYDAEKDVSDLAGVWDWGVLGGGTSPTPHCA